MKVKIHTTFQDALIRPKHQAIQFLSVRCLKLFNPGRFCVWFFILLGLTVFSFAAAFAKDEGTIGSNPVWNVLADAFYILRFPTHVLFWTIMQHGGVMYFVGLIANVIFYALIAEVLTYRLKKHRQQTMPSVACICNTVPAF